MDKAARAALLTAKGMDKTSENIADYVADLLRQGRASEVTDDLMAQADPQRLHQHYTSGNTGMDLPMDYASRMERAKQMGFDDQIKYHGGNNNLSAFEARRAGKGMQMNMAGVHLAEDPEFANLYAEGNGAQVYPAMTKGNTLNGTALVLEGTPEADIIKDLYKGSTKKPYWSSIDGTPTGVKVAAPLQTHLDQFPPSKTEQVLNKYGVGRTTYTAKMGNLSPYGGMNVSNKSPSELVSDPTNIRSQFARFDPRLDHLAHLSASTGGAMEFARHVEAVNRAGGQIAPSKYLPNVPRAVHAGGGKVDFVKDNPGGDWLAKKQSYAFEYPRMKGIDGAITGWMGGKSDLFLPTHVLKSIEPLNNEKRVAGEPRFDDLMSSVSKEGFDPHQKGNKVVVAVNHRGQPFVLEGNTRVAVAHAMGIPSVKAEVRYWNGAEEADGPMHPDKVSAMASDSPDMTKAAGGRIHAEDGGKMELRSRAAEAIRNQPQLKGSVDQLLAVAAKGKGVKQAELANAGRPAGNIISKEKLAQHFEDAAPDVRVEKYQNIPAVGHTQDERREYNLLSWERVNNRLNEDQISRWHDLHNKTMPKGGTKYGKWTLDVGDNYREHLLHLPSAGGEVNHRVLGAYPRDFDTAEDAHEFIDRMNRAAEQPGMEPIRDSLRQYPLTYSPETPPSNKDFQSSHWSVPNVVAHVRMKDLSGGNGLFVQEVQSDWGQEGREQGFYDTKNPHEIVRKGTKEVVSRHPNYSSMWDAYRTHPDADNLNYGDVRDEKVPQAPYVGNTQQWTDLALKHVLTEAAKNGKYKRVVFAPGEANADLYGQRQPISSAKLHVPIGMTDTLGYLYTQDKESGASLDPILIKDEKELISQLGRKHAKALLSQEPTTFGGASSRAISEPDMHLGGHGMVDYYNNIVHPSALKLLQQHDPSIQPEKPYEMPGQEGTDNYYKGLSLPMTETARQSILKNGFGTFKRGGTVDGEPDATTETAPARPENGPQAGGLPNAGGIRGSESVLSAPLSPHGEVDLQGLPKDILIPKLGMKVTAGHNPEIRQVARDYTKQAGIDYSPPTIYKRVDPNLGKRISDAYADMAHFPQHPLVSAAYDAMKRETLDQYRMIKKAGVKMEFYPDVSKDPYYGQPRLMTEDVNNNKHMFVYPTVQGGFGTGKQPKGHENNPLLGDSGERWNGQPVVFNDLFRAVHDYFGHVKEGLGFRGDGEENAWRSHAAMYSPLARIALGAETRGQNSLLNFGPNGEHNQTASAENTIYSPQKLGVMPIWALHEGAEFIKPEERAQMEAIYRHFGLGPEGFVEPKVQRAPSAFVGQQKMAPTAGMPPSGMFTSKPTLSKGGTVGKEEGGATGSLREKGLWTSAQAIKAGTGSREAHAALVNKIKPVSPYAAPVPPASDQQVHDALTKDKQPKAFAPRRLGEGTPVAVRLDIPAYEKKNTWVVSVHHPKTDFTAGEVIGYDSVAHIDNPRFGVHPTGALNIASGKPKATIATVHGNWKKTTPEDAFKLSQAVHNDPQWRQVGMDPERHSYFYDRETQEPVMAADEALHIGPLVYAKNPVYGKKTDFAFSKGGDVEGDDGITAYHGSPHSFDQFDIGKLGTGEGAQAYGHGLYFAANEKVAKSYRNGIALNKNLFDIVDKKTKELIDPNTNGYEKVKDFFNNFAYDLRSGDTERFKQDMDRDKKRQIDHIKDFRDYSKTSNDPDFFMSEAQRFEDGLHHFDAAKSLIDKVRAEPKGHMYKVKLNVKPEELLDWDKPLSEQPEVARKLGYASHEDIEQRRNALQSKMRPIDMDKFYEPETHVLTPEEEQAHTDAGPPLEHWGNMTGEDLHNRLVAHTGSKKGAANAMQAAGLKGIKYLDSGSRGTINATGSHNYVMFHHDPVQVVNKYEYGGAIPKARDVSAALALTRRFTKDGTGATMALKPKGK